MAKRQQKHRHIQKINTNISKPPKGNAAPLIPVNAKMPPTKALSKKVYARASVSAVKLTLINLYTAYYFLVLSLTGPQASQTAPPASPKAPDVRAIERTE